MSYKDLFGKSLLFGKEMKEVNTEELDLKGDDVLGIYFSAHWCPPCRAFTPKLADFYNKVNAEGKKFRIVFVSADRAKGDFESYFQSMPWYALPFEDRETNERLSNKCGVRGIPMLVLFNPNGDKMNILGDARSLVQNNPDKFPWLVESGKCEKH